MGSLWSFLRKPNNQWLLWLLGGGVVVILAGLAYLPSVFQAVVSVYRQVVYGGVIINACGEKLEIHNDRAIPGEVIVVRCGPKVVIYRSTDVQGADLKKTIETALQTTVRPGSSLLPPPGSQPSPPASQDTLKLVDDELAKLINANVAFNIPDHMRVTKTQVLQAKLAVNMTPDVLIASITEAGKKESQPLLVSNQMSATLSAGGAFDISPSGPQTQWISSTQETSWSWEVTPKQSGMQELTLAFDAHISIGGKEGTRTVNTLTRKIEVEVAWPESPSEWLTFVKETGENLGWLWATILVPVGLFVVKKVRKFQSHSSRKPAPRPKSHEAQRTTALERRR